MRWRFWCKGRENHTLTCPRADLRVHTAVVLLPLWPFGAALKVMFSMKLLFVADPLESFKIYKDTTFAMMREAQKRGHTLSACQPKDIMWQCGGAVTAFVRDITLTGQSAEWFSAEQQAPNERPAALKDFDAVVMRKDPPFDSEFFYATHLLEQAEREGARVFNKPRALRDHPEKLAILEWPQFIGPTLVTRDAQDIPC